ncbi:MAG: NRDE family protein [Planctomycetota bacterium]
MCTVTSHLDTARLAVTMNRDERRERAAETPPVVHPAQGDAPAWVAPIDSQSGGTWMGANDRGLVACLTNRYLPRDAEPRGPRPSRGAIIPALLARGGHQAARTWLAEAFDPTDYASFTLLLCSPVGREVVQWPAEQGLVRHDWGEGEGWAQFSSSSWRTEEVLAWRRARFAEWLAAGAEHVGHLPAYHLLQPDGLAEWAPLMARDVSVTRSITQVVVEPAAGHLTLRYWPAPGPAGGQPAVTRTLELVCP